MTSDQTTPSVADNERHFPATRESLIQCLVSEDPAIWRAAIAKLCSSYRDPIFFWLQRYGVSLESSEDAAQGFVAYLLEKNRDTNHFEKYVKGQTKFRSFLLEYLKRFRRDEWRKETADKRGGGVEPIPLEDHDIPTEQALDHLLDREFALAVHRRVMGRLEAKFTSVGRDARFHELQRYVLGDDPSVSYADVGARLNLKPNAVKKAVFDLRANYAEFFRQEVTETTSPETIAEEMRYLITLLADVVMTDAG